MSEQFGHYVLEDVIGRGGMGEVYRAYDTKRDRTVALKRLPKEMASDETFQARFRRECQLVARLNEPHVIPIHDFGEIEGHLYLDMRLVEGVDLSTIIGREGPLDAEAGRRHHRPGGGRAAVRARLRPRPPRHQAVEHPADRHERRPAERVRLPRRLRHRPHRGRRRHGADRHHRHGRNPRLHGSGADQRRRRRPPLGSLLAGLRAVRVPHRSRAVQGRDVPGHVRPRERRRRRCPRPSVPACRARWTTSSGRAWRRTLPPDSRRRTSSRPPRAPHWRPAVSRPPPRRVAGPALRRSARIRTGSQAPRRGAAARPLRKVRRSGRRSRRGPAPQGPPTSRSHQTVRPAGHHGPSSGPVGIPPAQRTHRRTVRPAGRSATVRPAGPSGTVRRADPSATAHPAGPIGQPVGYPGSTPTPHGSATCAIAVMIIAVIAVILVFVLH